MGALAGCEDEEPEALDQAAAVSSDEPVVVLTAGLGDGLDEMADLQKTLAERNRVCSYDRLGEGASDRPVVLAGHSLGGLIAARYAPGHRDRVAGLVLVDATSPTTLADTTGLIPESAAGPGAELRAQVLAVCGGANPEELVIADDEVRSVGDIPVEVVQHGTPYLQAVPEYGPGLERAWAQGQRAWLGVSTRSGLTTATRSAHHVHVDEQAVVVGAVQRVVEQAAKVIGRPGR
ncbi:alpha/beta fold hydrolase [Lentzea sp. NPDC060358]|uniref:alpha/beta fold hydrolase n=1 Tax=Lentzea sp. NPDC060358 TaxID=3347103 RepID=UPI0036672CF8